MDRPIRVFMIATGFLVEGKSGGVGRYSSELCEALDKAQVQVALCGLWYYGTQFEDERMARLQAAGIETVTAANWVEGASARNVWGAFGGLHAALAGRQVDIIHSHSEFADFAAAVLGHWHRIPVRMRTLHNHEWQRRPLLRPLARLLYPVLFDVEVGVSRHVVESLSARPVARLLSRRARHIPAAIGLGRHAAAQIDGEAKRASLGIPAGARVVGSVGRLSRQKGYDLFLRAAQIVLARLPDTWFLLVGEGEDAPALQGLAAELGLAGRVVFTGPRPDVEELLKVMDLFVSSSRWEGMPGVVLDSMAAGVAVAATDIPGTRDVVQDGVNGRLVPGREPEALGNVVVELLGAPQLRQVFALNGRKTVEEFSIERVAREYQNVYAEVIPTRSRQLETVQKL